MEEKKQSFLEAMKEKFKHFNKGFKPEQPKSIGGYQELVVTDKDGNKKCVGHIHGL